MESLVLTVSREGEAAIAIINQSTRAKLAFPRWSVALAFGESLAFQSRGIYGPDPSTIGGATIKRDGEFEVVSVGPQVFCVMPVEMALEIANAVIGKAREIETEESWEVIVFDQAILDRSNVIPSLGLVSDPWLLDEAMREAAWGTKGLRRYLPGGVRRQRKVSSPSVDKETLGVLSER